MLTRIPKLGRFALIGEFGVGIAGGLWCLDRIQAANRCGCAERRDCLLEVVRTAVVGMGADFALKGRACGGLIADLAP